MRDAWLLRGEDQANTLSIVQTAQLLSTGPPVVALYADASYVAEVGLGCWVYNIPSFPVLRFGIESVCSSNFVELAAVVHGLTATTAIDLTPRPLHLHTDSEYVLGVMDYVAKRLALPDRRSYRQIGSLYSQACDVTSGRAFTITRRCDGDRHHVACDKKAKDELRRYCREGSLAHKILLGRAQARRNGVVKQIRILQDSLTALEKSLLQCDMEVAALQYNSPIVVALDPKARN